ncbi:MAG: ATP-dependent DNA helicase RecG [Thalassobaculales bacterium]
MRPEILFPLFTPVTTLKGVGAKLAKAFEKLAGPLVVDVLWHLPAGLVDRRYAPPLAVAEPGRVATVAVTVLSHQPGSGRPYRVTCGDGGATLDLVFFHARADWLETLLPVGAQRVVSGRIDRFGERLQMVHPDHVVPPEEAQAVRIVEPVYRLVQPLTGKLVARVVQAALARAPALPEWHDPHYLARQGWPDWKAALAAAHAPAEEAELSPLAPARQRLAYDELLANQLALALVRQRQRDLPGRSLAGDGRYRRPVLAALGFKLTAAQERALAEITADMAAPLRMMRLLQGDVGSGKTVVALLAMLAAVEAGAQAALMAPTDLLARQHFNTIKPLCDAADVAVELLTGREKGSARAGVLARLGDGRLPLVIGTHALFQEEVGFADLGLAVIDEQHRFGVHQRLQLASKGRAVDVLVMTATPIPRTLTLTAYGDLDVSRLTGKPPGRKPVDTRTVPLTRIEEVIAAVGRRIAEGGRVYWVCPLVEESEKVDLAAAEERFQVLNGRFPGRVALAHGRLKGAEKDRAMAAFASGAASILVATTVIEVGVNVPEATVMVIEQAERFGLAQLHQLRGRVGRGDRAAACLLLYEAPLSQTARARLDILRRTEDGFIIAEEDLRLRGAGELLGTRQSGLPAFRLADLAVHGELLAAARDDVKLALSRDPALASPRGQALRVLLYLFERDAAARLLRSG